MAYRSPKLYRRVISTYIASPADQYETVAPHRDKSCGRVADKFGLRTWTINLRTWIFGLTCLVFKTTCIDTECHYVKALFSSRERCFFLRWMRGILAIRRREKRITSERYIGKLGVRYLSALNRAQDSRQQYPHRMRRREGEIASLPSRLRYFYPTGWRSSLLLAAGHTGRLGRGFLLIFDF